MPTSTNRIPKRSEPSDGVQQRRARIDAIVADPNAIIDLNEIYDGPEILPEDIGERVRTIQTYCNDYTWPFIKGTLHYLILSGMSYDAIARKFNVTVGTIHKWKARLKAEWSGAELGFDVCDQIIESIEFNKCVRMLAMQLAMETKNPRDKLAAMKTALQAEREINNLLQRAGAFNDAPLNPKALAKARLAAAGTKNPNADDMCDLLKPFLKSGTNSDDEAEVALQPVAKNGQSASVLNFPSVRERKPPRT